ncbi:MAG: hypothetical protein L0H94_00100 [Nitrospira sp.]|nr:hypothetical protein [Nitrospira sp.]
MVWNSSLKVCMIPLLVRGRNLLMRYEVVIAVVLSMILGLSMQVSTAVAGESAEAAQIDREVDTALKKLLEDTPEAEIFRKEARGTLVFPYIVKGGFMFGAQYGKGALQKEGKTPAGIARVEDYQDSSVIIGADGGAGTGGCRAVVH